MISATNLKAEKDQTKLHASNAKEKRDSKIVANQSSTDKPLTSLQPSGTADIRPSDRLLACQSFAGNDLILKISTRNAIINHLTSIPTYLFGPPVAEDAKERLFKESSGLMMNLASLPLRGENDKHSAKQVGQKSSLFLEISWDFKSKLVACLTSNLSYVAFYRDLVSTESKTKLMEENSRIIDLLLSLPMGEAKREPTRKLGSNCSHETRTAEGDQLAKKTKLEEKVDQISKIIDEIYVNRSEATFVYELKNATGILKSEKKHICDRNFYCRGIEWTLMLDFKANEQTKFLSLYLCTLNGRPSNWQIKGSYEIKILNQLGHEDRVENGTAIFKSSKFSSDYGWGYPEFVRLTELADLSKGLLKNDLIVFEVKLKADRLVVCDLPMP